MADSVEDQPVASQEQKQDNGEWEDVGGENDGGVLKKILVPGHGEDRPPKGVEVVVHYVGTLENGTGFDSSRDRDEPFKFKLGKGQVIRGWDQGIATMKKGEKAILKIRPDYGYGAQAQGKIPANSTLLFEVEMISWKVGENVTPDGGVVKIRTLVDGEGYKKPKDPLWVKVSYQLSRLDPSISVPEIINHAEDLTFSLGEDAVFSGLEKAVESMILQEHSVFSLSSSYLPPLEFSEEVQAKLSDSTFSLDVQLKEIEDEQPSWEMSTAEKIASATKRKDQATEFFRQNKFDLALRRYAKAADFISFKHDFSEEEKAEATTIETAVRLNRAAAFLKLKKWSDVITECDKVLKDDPQNTKALYRKALALEENLDWDEADALLQKVLSITPDDAAIKRERARLNKKVADYERAQSAKYRNLFA